MGQLVDPKATWGWTRRKPESRETSSYRNSGMTWKMLAVKRPCESGTSEAHRQEGFLGVDDYLEVYVGQEATTRSHCCELPRLTIHSPWKPKVLGVIFTNSGGLYTPGFPCSQASVFPRNCFCSSQLNSQRETRLPVNFPDSPMWPAFTSSEDVVDLPSWLVQHPASSPGCMLKMMAQAGCVMPVELC